MAGLQSSSLPVVPPVRVLLADDSPSMLDEACHILEHEFQIVGTVENGEDLLHAAEKLQPDVVILDISMPILNGLEAARQLKREGSRARIVFLTVHEDWEFVEESFVAGAVGYVIKPRLATDLVVAIRQAAMGKTFVSPAIVSSPKHRDDRNARY
jgi:DNA-binding NarL/FixJ family response regulator